MSKEVIISARDLGKIYRRGGEDVHAIEGMSLDIHKGEFVSIMGPSGSGKTTLLHIIGCLDNPTSGNLTVAGQQVFDGGSGLLERELTKFRREHFGYIFQNFYLLPTLTVRENVAVPLTFYRKEGAEGSVDRILDSLGMSGRKGHLPHQISGGEMQRVAIARALVNSPEILLADEPTGNLDSARSKEIGETIARLNREQGYTIVMVTHNPELAGLAGRIIELRDGKISL